MNNNKLDNKNKSDNNNSNNSNNSNNKNSNNKNKSDNNKTGSKKGNKKKKKSKKEDRKIFFWRNNKKKEIMAVGIFIIQDGKVLVQYIDNYDRYEDLGGKTELFDKTYFDTIARETWEEMNGSIYYNKKSGKNKSNKIKKYLDEKLIKKLIKNNKLKSIYSKFSKYLILFVNLPLKYKIDFTKSGNYEETNKIKRKIKWIQIYEFIKFYNKKKIHIRLRDKNIINFLKCFL